MNLTFRNLKRMGLKPCTIDAIEKYMDFYRLGTIEHALDSFGFRVGVKGLVQHTFDENYNTVGWTSTIRLEENNPITGKEEEIDFKLFKDRPSAYKNCCIFTLKKQLLYLDLIPNLDSFIYERYHRDTLGADYFNKLIN